MRFRFRVRRVVTFAALIGVTQMVSPPVARADLWGADVAVLTQILGQTLLMVGQLTSMLNSLGSQLRAMNTMLSKLDGASLSSMMDLIRSNEIAYEQLTRDINGIGYTMTSINDRFRSVYASDYRSTSSSDLNGKYSQWNNEILSSAEVAARAQSTISTLKNNSDNARAILNNSAAADGQVAQMQAIVQMLGVIQSQNNSIIQSLATAGRVTANVAAAGASEEHLSRERKRRNLEGYTDRGPPVPPMKHLP